MRLIAATLFTQLVPCASWTSPCVFPYSICCALGMKKLSQVISILLDKWVEWGKLKPWTCKHSHLLLLIPDSYLPFSSSVDVSTVSIKSLVWQYRLLHKLCLNRFSDAPLCRKLWRARPSLQSLTLFLLDETLGSLALLPEELCTTQSTLWLLPWLKVTSQSAKEEPVCSSRCFSYTISIWPEVTSVFFLD